MGDWGLNEEEQRQWDAYVKHFREETLKGMESSAFVMSLVPGAFDVRFAAEVGAAVLLDKPLVLIVRPGFPVSAKLRLIAEEIVEADVDLEAGQKQVAAAIKRLMEP